MKRTIRILLLKNDGGYSYKTIEPTYDGLSKALGIKSWQYMDSKTVWIGERYYDIYYNNMIDYRSKDMPHITSYSEKFDSFVYGTAAVLKLDKKGELSTLTKADKRNIEPHISVSHQRNIQLLGIKYTINAIVLKFS